MSSQTVGGMRHGAVPCRPDKVLRVFVSYARADDRDRYVRLLSGLIEADLQARQPAKVFLDQRDIPFGAAWRAVITQEISAADAMIVALSPAFVRSQECRFELDTFLATNQSRRPVFSLDLASLASEQIPTAIAHLNMAPWQHLRDRPVLGREVRHAVSRLATEICATAKPSGAPRSAAESTSATPPVLNATQGRDYASLRDAIEHATAGDRIHIPPGRHEAEFTVSKNLELVGKGTYPSETVLVGTARAAAVRLTGSRVLLSNLMIEQTGLHSALVVDGAGGVIDVCYFRGSDGPVIRVQSKGSASLSSVQVIGGKMAGIVFDDARGSVTDSYIAEAYVGVGALSGADVHVTRTTIVGARTTGVLVHGSVARVVGCDLTRGDTGVMVSGGDACASSVTLSTISSMTNTGVLVDGEKGRPVVDLHYTTIEACLREALQARNCDVSVVGCRIACNGSKAATAMRVESTSTILIVGSSFTDNHPAGLMLAEKSTGDLVSTVIEGSSAGIFVTSAAACRLHATRLRGHHLAGIMVERAAHIEATACEFTNNKYGFLVIGSAQEAPAWLKALLLSPRNVFRDNTKAEWGTMLKANSSY